jgi:hypothetical protein
MAALLLLVQVTEVVEPPNWVWPLVMGGLAGLWTWFIRPGEHTHPTEPAARA